jgi:hypothetical protein
MEFNSGFKGLIWDSHSSVAGDSILLGCDPRVFEQMVLNISKDLYATFFRINTPKKNLANDTE